MPAKKVFIPRHAELSFMKRRPKVVSYISKVRVSPM